MASKRTDKKTRKGRPASTPEARENQMVSMAIDLAEQQLQDGTASAQVISHYLKLGSSREKLEQEKLRRDNEFLEAKVEAMASHRRIEDLYEGALNAMRAYSGQHVVDEGDYDGPPELQ